MQVGKGRVLRDLTDPADVDEEEYVSFSEHYLGPDAQKEAEYRRELLERVDAELAREADTPEGREKAREWALFSERMEAESAELKRLKDSVPLGATSGWEPRSVHSKPTQLPWKRKLRP